MHRHIALPSNNPLRRCCEALRSDSLLHTHSTFQLPRGSVKSITCFPKERIQGVLRNGPELSVDCVVNNEHCKTIMVYSFQQFAITLTDVFQEEKSLALSPWLLYLPC